VARAGILETNLFMGKKAPLLSPVQLGKGGPAVSRLGLGCLPLSGCYGLADELEATALVHAALDHGINFIDTADVHGWGHNESLIGSCISNRRHDAVLATQFGRIGDGETSTYGHGRPEAVQAACEASLRRLKTNYIDLYYAHRVDPEVPIEETVGAMAALVQQGKVRAIGLCEASPTTIRRAHETHPLAAVQQEYSLLHRVQAEEILGTTKELGISFVAYAPLGRGFLTGGIRWPRDVGRDMRAGFPAFAGEHFQANLELVERLAIFAKAKKCTPSQAALAWLLAQDDSIVPIPGTRSAGHLDQDIGALKVQLTPEDVDELSLLIPPGAASGDRYPPAGMASAYR
jgi:aryl-alcohol dehydrogenase-like predicted oxidoreductase